MTTIRMFSAPHKALRRTMANFSVLAGQTNFNDTAAVEKLKSMGKELFLLLTLHAENEDKIILAALEAKLPGSTEHDKLDHIKIEHIQRQLEDQLEKFGTTITSGEAYDFYLQFAAFQSLYLEHINEEETVTQGLIWNHLTDEEQMAINKAIVKKMDIETYALWLKHIIPAQNETENLLMLIATSKNMPVPDFDSLMGALKRIMPEPDFRKLKSKLWITSANY